MIVRMPSTILVGLLLSATNQGGNVMHGSNVNLILCEARQSSSGGSSGRSIPSRRSNTGSHPSARSNSRRSSSSSKSSTRMDEYDDITESGFSDDVSEDDEVSDSQGYDQEIDDDYDNDGDDYDDFEHERESQRQRMPQSRSTHRTALSKVSPPSRSSKTRPRPSQPSSRASRSSQTSSRSSSRKVTPYNSRRRPPSAFSRGLTALRDSIPDPQTLKDTAISSISSARETTTRISSSLYREVKILSSSELEQAFLKATIPNDSPAKEKHVERLVMITYQVSAGFNIFEVVLRKLWSRMVESDWRTTIKAVYVLHRFGTDGSPQQQMALKTMLREMRRTRDPKRKAKYFNTKQLLEGDSTPANIMFRTFLARYAHYVLLRVQCFGGMFSEIDPKGQTSSLISEKPITSTRLKKECLDAAQVVLKAGLACKLKPMEECENTVVAMERVVSDMIGLTTAVAAALNSALNDNTNTTVDKNLIKLWCEFYSKELLPQTKAMIKSATPTLDAFGIFLPSRMGTTVSQDLLQKGLTYTPPTGTPHPKDVKEDEKSVQEDQEFHDKEGREEDEAKETDATKKDNNAKSHGDDATSNNHQVQENIEDEDDDEYDEYEYDEYYDTEFN